MNDRLVADGVLRTLEGASPVSLRTFAQGLALGDGPFRVLANPVDCFADRLEHDDVTGRLGELGDAARAQAAVPRRDDRRTARRGFGAFLAGGGERARRARSVGRRGFF